MDITNIGLLPRDPTDHGILDALIDRYKTLRLRALKESPDAFSSKYEDEAKFPRERWQARIQNPNARTFIAHGVATRPDAAHKASDNSALSALLANEWLGTLTLVGPESVPETKMGAQGLLDWFYGNRRGSSSLEHERSVLAYSLNGMHVLPEGRGVGNGRRLVEHALEYARSTGIAAGAAQVWLLAFVEIENEPALGFYQKCGFRVWDDEVFLEHRYVRLVDLRMTL